ncbi:MAG TPA: hypothetical protein VK524_05915 [Polyangiaceae bacterium]|nr:hypothetical protein [Polyangiaceae bacterium]
MNGSHWPPGVPRGARPKWILRALTLALVALHGAACGGPPPRTANPTRALDERRAIDIIIRAFHEERDEPIPGKSLLLADGTPLEVDVAAKGKRYGVSYITANERFKLGKALPPRDLSMGDALQLVNGTGSDAQARILVVHDSDYLYDDQVGTDREASTITAERKLARDVRDFLVHAHSQRWP